MRKRKYRGSEVQCVVRHFDASMRRDARAKGTEIRISDSHGLKINESGVQARNIEASNGVVHALDTVLEYDTKAFTTGPLAPTVETEKATRSQPAGFIASTSKNEKPAALVAAK